MKLKINIKSEILMKTITKMCVLESYLSNKINFVEISKSVINE